MFSLTWPREAAGTKLVVGESEPSSTKATTAAGDAAFGVMLHRRLNRKGLAVYRVPRQKSLSKRFQCLP